MIGCVKNLSQRDQISINQSDAAELAVELTACELLQRAFTATGQPYMWGEQVQKVAMIEIKAEISMLDEIMILRKNEIICMESAYHA